MGGCITTLLMLLFQIFLNLFLPLFTLDLTFFTFFFSLALVLVTWNSCDFLGLNLYRSILRVFFLALFIIKIHIIFAGDFFFHQRFELLEVSIQKFWHLRHSEGSNISWRPHCFYSEFLEVKNIIELLSELFESQSLPFLFPSDFLFGFSRFLFIVIMKHDEVFGIYVKVFINNPDSWVFL